MSDLRQHASLQKCQLRAARALLGWSVADVTHAAAVSRASLNRAENDNMPTPSVKLVRLLALTYEAAGVEFTYDRGPGVRLSLGVPPEKRSSVRYGF